MPDDDKYTYPLEFYKDREYRLTVSASPSFDDVDDFAVVVYYADEMGEKTQVARIDTAHGGVHFDRLYRRDQPKDDSVDMEWYEAEEHLRENWRHYAEKYEKSHG